MMPRAAQAAAAERGYGAVTRDRLERLTAWLRRQFGGPAGHCPSNEEIMARLQLSSPAAVVRLLTKGQDLGYLRVTGQRDGSNAGRHVVLLRSAGAAAQHRTQRSNFCRWLGEACAGDRRVYYTGHLGEARGQVAAGAAPHLKAAVLEAAEALAAEQAELVFLTTRRVEGGHEYIAICRRMAGERAA